jgi:hypothetical protein
MYFSSRVVDTITADRLREAEAARHARGVADEKPQTPRRSRRLRRLATRLVFSALR